MNQRITDLETALIFLREGLERTKNLQAKIAEGKAESPDIPYRIERIEGAIRRFGNEVADYRADILNAQKEAERERKEKEREERESERAERRAAERAAKKAAKEAEKEAISC